MRRLADIMAPENNSFGVVRLLMASAVLVSHSYWFATGSGEAEPLYSLTGRSLGEHAVQVFFFLSGVLVTQSLLTRASVIEFVTARALRIFPGLAVCVLATALLLGPAVSQLTPFQYFTDARLPSYIAKTLLLMTGSARLPGVFETVPLSARVNVSLWTLKYEAFCYAALAALAALGFMAASRRRALALLIVLMVATVFVGEPKPAEAFTALDTIRYFAVFFGAGTLACLVQDKLPIVPILLLPLAALYWASIGTRFVEPASALFLGYATICMAAVSFGALRKLTTRQDLSYGIYIYAAPVQQTLLSIFPGISPIPLTLAAALPVFILAFLSWNLVERPALRLRKRLFTNGHQPGPTAPAFENNLTFRQGAE